MYEEFKKMDKKQLKNLYISLDKKLDNGHFGAFNHLLRLMDYLNTIIPNGESVKEFLDIKEDDLMTYEEFKKNLMKKMNNWIGGKNE